MKLGQHKKEVSKEMEGLKARVGRLKTITSFSSRPGRVDPRTLEIASIFLNIHCGSPCDKCEKHVQRNCLTKVREKFVKSPWLISDEKFVDTILGLIS